MSRAPGSCAAVVASGMSLAFASAALVHAGSWPSSDLDGHIGMVELYRRALSHGILWPYDRTSAAGMDALPYYAWVWELVLGACAQGLHLLGVPAAACGICKALSVLAIMALPWAASRCSQHHCLGTDARERRWAGYAGALAAWTFLATHTADGISGYGMDALSLGLLEQSVGWVLLLLFAGSLARAHPDAPCARGRWAGLAGVDRRASALLSLVILVHTLSALAAAVLLMAHAGSQWRRVVGVAVLGSLGAAVQLAVLWQVHDQLLTLPAWVHLSGSDGLLAVLNTPLQGQGLARWLFGAGPLCALMLLGGAVAAWRRATPGRVLVVASVGLTVMACLPLSRLLLPASCQAYRLQAPALLLALVAGASMAPQLRRALAGQVRPALAWAALSVAWCGLGADQACSWGSDPRDAQPAACACALRARIPAGSRVLMADQVGWHRWMVDSWKWDLDWESLGCLHPVVAPPLLMAAAPAAESLGVALCAVDPVPAVEPRVGSAILDDLGVTVVIRRRTRADAPGTDALDQGWTRTRWRQWQLWTLARPRPRLEAITEGLVGVVCPSAGARVLLPAWAAAAHAREPRTPRLVLLDGVGESLPQARGMIVSADGSERGGDDSGPTLRVAWSAVGEVQDPALQRGATPGRAQWSDLCNVLAGVPRFLRQLPVRPGTPGGHPDERWRDENTCELSGLRAAHPYLLRYGFSPGMRSRDGRILCEASGMTVVVPRGERMVITIARCSGVIIAGGMLSLLTWATHVAAWVQGVRRAARWRRQVARAAIGCRDGAFADPRTR